MDTSLATVLEHVADEARERVAIIHGDVQRTWRELDDHASRVAGRLSEGGVGPGDRVAVALYNGPEYIETVLAILKLRALPVNVNYRYRQRELLELLTDAGPAAIVLDGSLAPLVGAVAGDLPGLRTFLTLGPAEEGPDFGGDSVDYDQVVRESTPMPRIERFGDDGWLMFTGGTTGRPKGVLSEQSWLIDTAGRNGYPVVGEPLPDTLDEALATARKLIDGGKSLRTLVAPPLMHATGQYMTFGTLLTGGTVAYLPSRSYDADELAREVARLEIGNLCIVGDVFSVPLADALEKAADAGTPYDLSCLRRIVSVGVLWSAEVKARLLQHLDATLDDLLAASEGGPFARSSTTREQGVATARFSLLPGARVLNDEGKDVKPGEVGHVAGPAPLATKYLGDEEKTAQTYRMIDGERYVVPGDLATVEEDGSLVLLGRHSRVINTGGEKVFAEEVEQVIAEREDVVDVNVVGLPDERWGHRIVAVVALKRGASPSAEELIAHVADHLAGYKRPRQIVFVPEIQRSPSGKLDLRWVRQVAADQGA